MQVEGKNGRRGFLMRIVGGLAGYVSSLALMKTANAGGCQTCLGTCEDSIVGCDIFAGECCVGGGVFNQYINYEEGSPGCCGQAPQPNWHINCFWASAKLDCVL
jgi:hypothetical protein